MEVRARHPRKHTPAAAPEGLAAIWPRSFALEELRELLGDEVDTVICGVVARQVNAPLWDLVDRGGKQWRSAICRHAYLATGGTEPVPPVCGVVELLHNGSLMIDDIEDGASARRGGPAAHVVHGVPTTLNAANAAYFRALAALKAALPDVARLRALDMLSEELFTAHLGQALDLALGTRLRSGLGVTTAHYRALARAKTGGLARIAARLGAIAAGADDVPERALAGWAGELGVAFQIRDDLDDLDEGLRDFAAGRVTYPLLVALDRLPPENRERVTSRFGTGSAAGDARHDLVGLLRAHGLVEGCRAAGAAVAAEAVAYLDALPSGAHRDALAALTWRLSQK
jgi:geranylgeranyl diphosphate synthase type I